MFQLTDIEPNSSEFYFFLSYGVIIFLQIFMCCWFGNEVEVKSNNIAYAVYECDWINFSETTKKDLIFFVMKAQRPVKLSALNLVYLSLETFMRIMKSSWSIFALLNQVASDE
ncbi:hypothetical protein Zmor_007816 [Zophobas morio]|uniref:Uncharacterized protein n=1 Tax=Zophobas morio TaxID=2755281 RepID=A0AA38IW99_9CUCU|nr:hypothetical protein Zmor_007816 [Zophobas morio]